MKASFDMLSLFLFAMLLIVVTSASLQFSLPTEMHQEALKFVHRLYDLMGLKYEPIIQFPKLSKKEKLVMKNEILATIPNEIRSVMSSKYSQLEKASFKDIYVNWTGDQVPYRILASVMPMVFDSLENGVSIEANLSNYSVQQLEASIRNSLIDNSNLIFLNATRDTNPLSKVVYGAKTKPLVSYFIDWIKKNGIDATFTNDDRCLELYDMIYAGFEEDTRRTVVLEMLKVAVNGPYTIEEKKALAINVEMAQQGYPSVSRVVEEILAAISIA